MAVIIFFHISVSTTPLVGALVVHIQSTPLVGTCHSEKMATHTEHIDFTETPLLNPQSYTFNVWRNFGYKVFVGGSHGFSQPCVTALLERHYKFQNNGVFDGFVFAISDGI